jgi:hypothetical protein
MVTVTQGWFHFYVQNCVDSAIVHEFFYNSCNSVIVVRTPCAVERAFCENKDEELSCNLHGTIVRTN